MRRFPYPALLLLLSSCGGHFFAVTRASSTANPDDAYACVQTQLKTLGYERKRYDPIKRWYVGQFIDREARLSDARFRYRINRLDVLVSPDATGNTSLEIKAQSYDVFDDQKGLDEIERSATNDVKRAAASLAEACGK